MLLRTNMPITASSFAFGSLALGLLGLLVGSQFMPTVSGAALFGVLMMGLPFLYLRILEHRALLRFEEQLPEALDLLARAVRSGHAISAGMEMVAEEIVITSYSIHYTKLYEPDPGPGRPAAGQHPRKRRQDPGPRQPADYRCPVQQHQLSSYNFV